MNYDVSKWKILLDGKRVHGFLDKIIDIDNDGVTLYLSLTSPVLKDFRPRKLTAIYFGEETTVITKLKVESIERYPLNVGVYMPIQAIRLNGKIKTKYTD